MNKISVFYRPEQTVDARSYSKSPLKPKLVVEDWLANFSDNIAVRHFEPVTAAQLLLAHSDRYVTGVLSGEVCNGFGNNDLAVAKSLTYTSGSMLATGKQAVLEGIAVSPTSGFHHACFNGGGGYCTFNALLVTAIQLYDSGLVDSAGILDMDYHYGNGTDDIIRRKKLSYVDHMSIGKDYYEPQQAEEFLNRLEGFVDSFDGIDLLLVQCGADPHIDDPLGGFLTTKQLQERDSIVFKRAKKLGIPVAWNLAGGYQRNINKVLEVHHNTMLECLKVWGNS